MKTYQSGALSRDSPPPDRPGVCTAPRSRWWALSSLKRQESKSRHACRPGVAVVFGYNSGLAAVLSPLLQDGDGAVKATGQVAMMQNKAAAQVLRLQILPISLGHLSQFLFL